MKSNVLEGISDILRTSVTRIRHEDVPASLRDTKYILQRQLGQQHCPECGEPAHRSQLDQPESEYRITCFEIPEHEFEVSENELLRYDLDTEAVVSDIAVEAGLTPIDPVIERFPDFAAQATQEEVLVCLLGPAKDEKRAVQSVVSYVLERRVPALLFTPKVSVEELYELIEPYATAGLIQLVTISMVADPAYVAQLAESLRLEQEAKQELFDEQGISTDDIRWNLEEHPTLIKNRLQTLRSLRKNSRNERSGIGRTIWTDFEKVCKAAFSYLEFELKLGEGGVDAEGGEVPDAVIGYPQMDIPDRVSLPRLLGVVDAKSSARTTFDDEPIDKQLDYFDPYRGDKQYAGVQFAHIFVVFDIDADKMVDWFDRAKPHYPDETGLVVLTAGALRALVNFKQSPATLSAVNRSEYDSRHLTRHFFDPNLYGSPQFKRIAEMPDLRDWGADKDATQSRYEYETRLLFVTKEMVTQWIQRSYENAHGTDAMFDVDPVE